MPRWTAIALLLAAIGATEVLAQCDPLALTATLVSDTDLCAGDSTTLLVTGDIAGAEFQWQDSTTAWEDIVTATDSSIVVSPETTTFYRCLVSCTDTSAFTDTVQVIVHERPVITATLLAEPPFCGQFSDTLVASMDTGDGSFAWIPITGLEPTTGAMVVATVSENTTYAVIGFDVNGCSDTDSVSIQVHDPPTAHNPADVTLCASDSTTTLIFDFTGVAPVNFILQTPGGQIHVDGYDDGNFAIDSLVSGEYFIASMDDGICPALEIGDTTVVTVVMPLDTVYAHADSSTICEQNSADLVGNSPGPFTGFWSFVAGSLPGQIVPGNSDSLAVFIPDSVGTYLIQWTISGTTCPILHDTVTIEVVALSDPAYAGPDTSMCSGGSIALSGSDPSPGIGTWSILSGTSAVISDVHSNTPTFTPSGPGDYAVQWNIDNAPCIADSDAVHIHVIDPGTTPTIIGMDDTLACNGEYQTFIVPGFNAGINYTWQCSDWETDNITGDTVTVHWQYPGPLLEPVTSTILLITNGGCPDTTAIAWQLYASPASCPKGIVYFEPQGLAILDPAAHYFQWGRLIGTEFVADPSRTDQTTFDAGHIVGCDTIPYYVVRTSIDGQQCWSTTLFCATPESIGRDCDQGGMILEGTHVRAYPNPSGGGPVTLEAIGESDLPLRIDLADARGRSILTRQLPLNGVSTLVLDLASLEPGIYLLRAWNTETDHMIKLVID